MRKGIISFDDFLDYAKSSTTRFQDWIYNKYYKKELINLYALTVLGDDAILKESDIDKFKKCLLDIDYSLLTLDFERDWWAYYDFIPGVLYSVDFLEKLILKSEGKIIPAILFNINYFKSKEEIEDIIKFIIDNKVIFDKRCCKLKFSKNFYASKYSNELFELNQENILLGISEENITNEMILKCDEKILSELEFLPDCAYNDGRALYKILNVAKKNRKWGHGFFNLEKYVPGTLTAPQILKVIDKFYIKEQSPISNLFFGQSKNFIKKCINLRPSLVLYLNYDWLYSEGYFIYICNKFCSKKRIGHNYLTSFFLKAPIETQNNKKIQKFILENAAFSIMDLDLKTLLKDKDNVNALLNNKSVDYSGTHYAFCAIVSSSKNTFNEFPELLLKICKTLIKEEVSYYPHIKTNVIDFGIYKSKEEFILDFYKENVRIIKFKEVFDTLNDKQRIEVFTKQPLLLRNYTNSSFANDAKNIYELISLNAKVLSFIRPENITEWHISKAYSDENAKYIYSFIKKYQFKLKKLNLNILEIYKETRNILLLDFLSEDELLSLLLNNLVNTDMNCKRKIKKKINKLKVEFI